MRRCTVVLGISALVVACGADRPPDPRPAAHALRLVTWNVHDLFDEVDRVAPPGELDTVLAPADVEAKLARVGRVLARADADVVVLQEVENLALLERLAAGPLAGMGYAAYLRDGVDPRGIDVGVLARVPVDAYVSHLGERAADGTHLWSRDCAELHLGAGGRPVVLLGNHLVSRLDPAQDGRRAEQATRLRAIADALRAEDARRLVVILGDLNDVPGSAALRPLLGDGSLADLGSRLTAENGWTWAGGGARERIDYALVPQEDSPAAARVEVLGGEDVSAASDHRPVALDMWVE